MNPKLASVLALLAVGSGCASEVVVPLQTTAVDPSTIAASIDVTSNGSAATVQMIWSSSVDTTKALVVGPGDRLVVRAADAPARDLALIDGNYFALIPTSASAITIALLRPAGEIAIDVPLADPFVVVGPAGTVPRSAPIALTWTKAPGSIVLDVTSPCFSDTVHRGVAQDTGGFTFYPGDFASGTAACTLSIRVARERAFAPASAFKVVARVTQARTIELETTP